ncbi:hypothetical protein ACLB2K_060206 [Fragaria x ananassa]
MKFISYQVRRPSGKPKGELTFSYKFGEKVTVPKPAKKSEPVMAYPVGATKSTGYLFSSSHSFLRNGPPESSTGAHKSSSQKLDPFNETFLFLQDDRFIACSLSGNSTNNRNQQRRKVQGWVSTVPSISSALTSTVPSMGFHLLSPHIHRSFHDLSLRFGPIFTLRLGSVPCIVVTSPELAKEFLKTLMLSFINRSETTAVEKMTYNASFAFAPYGNYWKFTDPVFDPRKSSSFSSLPCSSPLCRHLDSPGCSSKSKTCLYQVSYGDGSFTFDDFSTETLTFRRSKIPKGLFVGAVGEAC